MYTHAVDSDGQALEIRYFLGTKDALINKFAVYMINCPKILMNDLCPKDVELLTGGTINANIKIFSLHRGRVKITEHCPSSDVSTIPFPLWFLIKDRKKVCLIKSVHHVTKCAECGSFYKNTHTCNSRRRDFYFHHISAQSSDWWENINFFPIGSCEETRRLFVTYDVETYTWHGKFGKQVVPFMLVFKLTGDAEIVLTASTLAVEHGWSAWGSEINTFYYLNPQKNAIGKLFKQYRDVLQQRIVSAVWTKILSENPKLREHALREGFVTTDDLTFQEVNSIGLKGQPHFIEIYIIGHNINGFDEIVLAAQVINNKTDVPTAFKVTRNFMPRCGKILFNDITFSLPNPTYKPKNKHDYATWEQGICETSDLKYQYIKFMVRDTYALTHTSLKNAAAAYNLPVEKGYCPYKAINEFYMTGSYRTDDDSFPQSDYWSSYEEYVLNKNLWLEKHENAYDIVRHTLEYCITDVIVTSKLVEKLEESYQQFISESVHLPASRFNIFQRPTISSNSHAIFRQILYRQEKPGKAHLGDVLLAPSGEMYDYIRSSIRGGRCYPTYLGVLEEPIYVYDICGMYASALTHPMPAGRPLNPFDRAVAVSKWERQLMERKHIDYFDSELLPGIFTIDADPPAEIMLDNLPPFCSRKGGRLCWTNESLRAEVATSIDVITLHNRGWHVKLVPDKRTTVFPEWKCLAGEYVQLNIAAKERADREKNQTLRSISKLLSNSLYGSFATKLDNKITVFSDQIEEKYTKGIRDGTYNITASSFVETDNLSAEVMPEFVVAYSPANHNPEARADYAVSDKALANDSENEDDPFYSEESSRDPNNYTFKPITFLEADESALCLQTLEKNNPLIHNNKYPSHIASFVLAWTRAFISEWADFLYSEDRGFPIEHRKLKSVYGDTDSLFVTAAGKKLMETKGKHRLKKNGGSLVFDANSPNLTWLVECETQCEKCGGDAYSEESVFLAPKLYALKNTVCDVCKHVGPGKLRAKGHATYDLSYEMLCLCCRSDEQLGRERYATTRTSLKKTLLSKQSHCQPFTVTENVMTRTLRPWKDITLHRLDMHHLIPYSNSNPNPRNKETCWMELP